MAKQALDDALWDEIQGLLPDAKPRRFRFPGRKPIPDRQALEGILFVLRTGIPWRMLPLELGCGSGVSCWRRFNEWKRLGAWGRIHAVLSRADQTLKEKKTRSLAGSLLAPGREVPFEAPGAARGAGTSFAMP